MHAFPGSIGCDRRRVAACTFGRSTGGPDPSKSVIAEVYPAIFSKRYGRENRSPDEHDAYSTARWMSDMAERDALKEYFSPPLSDEERAVARLEGWILGIR